jgi:hypothetical protein
MDFRPVAAGRVHGQICKNYNGVEGCFPGVVCADARSGKWGTLSTLPERMEYLERLVSLLEHKVSTTKEKLATILADDSDILGGRELPPAHGVVHSLCLIAEARDSIEAVEDDRGGKTYVGVWRRLSVEQF